MKLFTASFIIAAGSIAHALVIKRSQCSTSSDPDCIAGFNDHKAKINFDDIQVTTGASGTPLSDHGGLSFTGFQVLSEPAGGAHVTPQSKPNIARTTLDSNKTSITSSGDIFKFTEFFFGCEQDGSDIATPCTLTITGYNPIGDTPDPVGNVSLEYKYGQPGANGQSPLQKVTGSQLADLSHANYYVFSAKPPVNSPFKPRVVLDDISFVWYKTAVQHKFSTGESKGTGPQK